MKNFKNILFGMLLLVQACAHAEVVIHELKWTALVGADGKGIPSDKLYLNDSDRPKPDAAYWDYGGSPANSGIRYPSVKVEPKIDRHLVETSELEEVRALITSKDFSPEQLEQIKQLIRAIVKPEVLK